VIGAVLAGGASRRFGRAKMLTILRGRPMIDYPLQALRAALGPEAVVAVVAKRTTQLPPLSVPIWQEPDEPQHPLCGLREALRRGDGADVLVCAGDMPLIDAAELRALLDAAAGTSAPVVLALVEGRLQPLCGLWRAEAAAALAATGSSIALHELARELGALAVARDDARPYLNVNTPTDLRLAATVGGKRGPARRP
jgi:molybdopterin-guanine dinucleotide biosynthesis protein A